MSESDTASQGRLARIWRSRYTYASSSRDNQEFTGQHYVLLLQRENQLRVRALPGSQSQLTMNLTIDGTADLSSPHETSANRASLGTVAASWKARPRPCLPIHPALPHGHLSRRRTVRPIAVMKVYGRRRYPGLPDSRRCTELRTRADRRHAVVRCGPPGSGISAGDTS